MNDEDRVRLSIVLSSIVDITHAKNNLMKASIAFMKSVKEGVPMDEAATLALIDEALSKIETAIEEAKVFRNIVRDERKPSIKNMAQRHARNPHLRDTFGEMPRHYRDPQDIINRAIKRPAS